MVRKVEKLIIDEKNRVRIPLIWRRRLDLVHRSQLNAIYYKGLIIIAKPNYSDKLVEKECKKTFEKLLGYTINIKNG